MNRTIKKTASVFIITTLLLSFGISSFADEYNIPDMIDSEELTSRMDRLLDGKSGDICVGYYYSQTGEEWYYNADVFMYSASLYKVPNVMLLEEKENAGEITQDTLIDGYTVYQQEYAAIVNSDNDRGHDIVRYNGGGEYSDKCADKFIKYTSLSEEYFNDERFTGDSYYTARFYNQILMYLYNHPDEYTHTIDLMKQTQLGHYLNLMRDYDYEVAQKYGAYDNKPDGKVFHAAGIIYTPYPIVVTVMTRNAGYDEQLFGDVANLLVTYTLELDETIDKNRDAYLATPTPEPTPEQTPQIENTPEPAPVPTPTPEPAVITKNVSPMPFVIVGVVLLGAGLFLAYKFKPEKPKKEKKDKYVPKH